jgi:aminopeptidase N
MEAMNERLISERNRVINFSKQYDHPIIDTTYTSLMNLLNPTSYQKGAWFLHMLRNEVGDSIFWSGIREYYETYKYSNAATSNFQTVMESVSGRELADFFHQCLRESLHPILNINNGRKCGKNYIEIEQKQQSDAFEFDLEVEFQFEDGTTELQTFHMSERKQSFKLKTKKNIVGFKYDPNVKLLFEMVEN